MATTEESALKHLNGERQPNPNRRVMLAAFGGALLGGTAVYAAPRVWDWAYGEDGQGANRVLSWQSAKLQTDHLGWQTFEHDKNAGRLPRSWHTVGVMQVEANAYDATRLELQEAFGVPLAQAVAFQAGSEVQIGVSNKNGQLQDFLGVHRSTEETANDVLRTVGMRIGPGDLRASIGYYAAGVNTFIIAPEVQDAGVVPINSLETQFPGAVWV